MKTLIEIYDERPLENVLATDVFRPETTVYLCPEEIAQNRSVHEQIRSFFRSRGISSETVFLNTSLLHTDKVIRQLETVCEKYPDCAIDITGGSDAALFAAGQYCSSSGMPVFTYSNGKHCFFSIQNAEFAHHLKPELNYSISDFICMAGGTAEKGRADYDALHRHFGQIDDFYAVFMKYRRQWKTITQWFQNATQTRKKQNADSQLKIETDFTVKGERGSRISANPGALKAFERLGFIHNLKIVEDEKVSFVFDDSSTRFWLRDTGSVLELYSWKACLDTGLFNDVLCSTIIKWNDESRDVVSNEVDVMASTGIIPVFISCKTCAVDTDAINELTILKEYFGGDTAKGFVISTEKCRAITKRRASSLGIDIISLDDLKSERLSEQIKAHFE